eukprot:GHVL01004522.1.p1 GENE.GHVL01004522.1~~GHVL01004522.1.p1  ORF type:complete len:119 (+),score=19.31 GHVL01004522.1:12-368(+)
MIPCTRVNKSSFPSFVGKNVTFIGRVTSVRDKECTMMSPDDKETEVLLECELPKESVFVEMCGVVTDDLKLEQKGPIYSLGDSNADIDLQSISRINDLVVSASYEEVFRVYQPMTAAI